MEYAVYKMEFSTGVHFGNMNLEDSEMVFHADTLFSAICQQMLTTGGEEALNRFVAKVDSGKILISDAFPFDKEHYFIPKPMLQTKRNESGGESSEIKKQYKKMQYIPADQLETYLNGEIDPVQVNERIRRLGKKELRTAANVLEKRDTIPYHIGVYHFAKDCGLYFILGYETEDDHEELEDCLLGISSIGGKRSSGLGRFELKTGKLPDNVMDRLDGSYSKYIALSVCLAEETELPGLIEEAGYGLIRRGGFVDSQMYSEEYRRKNDVYLFVPGSVFTDRFEGKIINVAINGSHPVWKYAKPVWMGVEV